MESRFLGTNEKFTPLSIIKLYKTIAMLQIYLKFDETIPGRVSSWINSNFLEHFSETTQCSLLCRSTFVLMEVASLSLILLAAANESN